MYIYTLSSLNNDVKTHSLWNRCGVYSSEAMLFKGVQKWMKKEKDRLLMASKCILNEDGRECGLKLCYIPAKDYGSLYKRLMITNKSLTIQDIVYLRGRNLAKERKFSYVHGQ